VTGGLSNRGDSGGRLKLLPNFYPKKPKNTNLAGNKLDSVPIGTEIERIESLFTAQEGDILQG
jgi:hypothetical protein